MDSEEEKEKNDEYLLNKLKLFFKNFRYQDGRYQIIWIMRMLFAVIIIAAAIYGNYLKYKK